MGRSGALAKPFQAWHGRVLWVFCNIPPDQHGTCVGGSHAGLTGGLGLQPVPPHLNLHLHNGCSLERVSYVPRDLWRFGCDTLGCLLGACDFTTCATHSFTQNTCVMHVSRNISGKEAWMERPEKLQTLVSNPGSSKGSTQSVEQVQQNQGDPCQSP